MILHLPTRRRQRAALSNQPVNAGELLLVPSTLLAFPGGGRLSPANTFVDGPDLGARDVRLHQRSASVAVTSTATTPSARPDLAVWVGGGGIRVLSDGDRLARRRPMWR
uniref:Uncharacterized protein n=1 Tax=Leersia perrieri TaxID=77586 RepID=A0A0D9V2E3_9ORYZ